MISIIICSRKEGISPELSANIATTIGCEYELIVIDNSANKYSIFEAYNKGIKESQSTILCFMHDDILFHSNNWGTTLLEIFAADNKIGLVGVAGSKAKTKAPSGWWNTPQELKQVNIIQHIETGEVERWEYGLENTLLAEVVAIDGVFMAARRDKSISFDTALKGFHNYDLNISLEYKAKGYKIMVTKAIDLEHFSSGNINKAWYEATQIFHNKYQHYLPLVTHDVNENFDLQQQEFNNALMFIYDSLNFGLNFNIMRKWFSLLWLNYRHKTHKKIAKRLIKNLTQRSN